MPDMHVSAALSALLAKPIQRGAAQTDQDATLFLEDLQANILKSHGRHHTAQMFLSFKGLEPEDVAEIVRALGARCTSADTQLRTSLSQPPYLDGGPVYCLFLSAHGYNALGELAEMPEGEAFRAGMAARQSVLNDPARPKWSPVGWQGDAADAMFLIADANAGKVTADLERVEGWLNGSGARILVIERGLQQTRMFRAGQKPEAVEHFGYVDGRSQPLILQEEVDEEMRAVAAEPARPARPGDVKDPGWSPAFPPSQFIVADPNGRRALSAGSYFVFRKLEQNVRGFNQAEEDLGKAYFGPTPSAEQLNQAGAMVVGRFEDGTPLTLDSSEQGQAVPNGFSYINDAAGAKCPFHAHIRKTNPRGDIVRQFNLPEQAERDPIMIRRGITYGAERPKNADKSEFDDKGREPIHDSGLLFMAYMADIEAQFEFTQKSWANNPDFVVAANGIDPVIGQTKDTAAQRHLYRDGYTPGAPVKELSFGNFVHMQGGEYFFAPSLSFLRGVGS